MTVVTVKDRTDTQVLLAHLQTWQRDAKKYGQTALYDLLHETCTHIRRQEKALADTGREAVETFTHNEADAAFSDYIRARAGYCCERCGKRYPAKGTGLQCSHHFSRRHFAIRYHPDNAAALCYHCHNYWFAKDIPEAARWLEEKIGRERIDALIALKQQPQKRQSASEIAQIAAYYRAETEKLNGKAV